MRHPMEEYLSGARLYGDDFGPDEIAAWYESEREGYAGIVEARDDEYAYTYHAINSVFGFDHIVLPAGAHALGLGSAYCEEFRPVLDRLASITALEPAESFESSELDGVPIEYVPPAADGTIPFDDDHFDLVTSLGVLHHVPNVSYVLSECHRCLKPGGTMLIREPIVAMGDWRQPRSGLTRNERGIPIDLFREIVSHCGFVVKKKSLHDFGPYLRVAAKFGNSPHASRLGTRLDWLLCQLTRFNLRYQRTSLIEKLGPSSLLLVLEKR